jgi:hypothetical protein
MDDQGEWPLCEECFNRIEDEFAPLPLPDFTSDDKTNPKTDSPDPDSPIREPHKPDTETLFPFGLSKREYQVVCMYDKTNQEIAKRLFISESTVASHWRSAMEKMEIQSRREVPYVLNLLSHDAVPPSSGHLERDQLSGFEPPLTFSLTITGSLEELQSLLKNLWRLIKRRH